MLGQSPERVTGALWVLWLFSWCLAAVWSSRTVKRPALGRQLIDRVITAVGVILLFDLPLRGLAEPRRWRPPPTGAWSLTVVVALGIGFAWWARLHLGRLWSGTVTQKVDHRIVDTGPYAIVRHPIYTGLLLSVFATAAIAATASAWCGAMLIALGFYLKARLEEQFLRVDLGVAYDEYRRRVPMLIPFLGSR